MSILFLAFLLAAEPAESVPLVAPARAVISGAAGIHAVLPSLGLRVLTGAGERFDVFAGYETHAGLAHQFSLGVRWVFSQNVLLSLSAAHGFFALEEISGIDLADAPFGDGTTTTLSAVFGGFAVGNAAITFEGGLTMLWLASERSADRIERVFDPALQNLHFGCAARWEDGRDATFLAFRATVPIEANFRVFGYIPWIAIGRSWSLP